MSSLLSHKPSWIDRMIERKLAKMTSNPKRKRKTRRAAKCLLQLKRLLDRARCW